MPLFDKHGGFRRLHSFTLATIIQLETLRFCRRFLTFDHRDTSSKFYDPKGRQYDQMTQAARSGRQNIIEGSERSSTSKDTEMKLTDVARASLSELRGDYEIFIMDRGQLPWSALSPEAQAVNAVSLDAADFDDDPVHQSARHAIEQRKKYARWLDAEDAVTVANAMLIIITRALNMLKAQIARPRQSLHRNRWFQRTSHGHPPRSPRCPQKRPTLPPVPKPHAAKKVRQRRLLGLFPIPSLQRHPPHLAGHSTRHFRQSSQAHPKKPPAPVNFLRPQGNTSIPSTLRC